MKKITFLLLAILPLIGMAQITNSTFDSDVSGWIENNGTVTFNGTEGSAAAGSLQLVTTVANGRAQSSPNTAPSSGAGNYLLTFKVKGTTGNKVQASIFQAGVSSGAQLTLTGGWDTYSFTFTGVTTANMNIRLIGKEAGTTYFFDDVEFTPLSTEDAFVVNPNFETTTDWTIDGAESTLSYITTTPQEGSQSGRLTFDVNQTANQFIENTVFNLGETVSPTEISSTFWVRANKAGAQVQLTYSLYDAAGTLISNNNTATYTIVAADTWEEVTFNKPITDSFNQIEYRIKVRSQSNALAGDTFDFDQITASFSFPTLSNEDFESVSTVFTVYPNPAKDIVTINGNSNLSAISIYDITGKKVLSTTKLVNNTLNISSLNSGLYLLKMKDIKGAIATKKLVVK